LPSWRGLRSRQRIAPPGASLLQQELLLAVAARIDLVHGFILQPDAAQLQQSRKSPMITRRMRRKEAGSWIAFSSMEDGA
jgi:hypothetical protein